MANPQPTDAHLRIAHEIQEQIMAREFTKRQRNILDLILRLSWGCGKKYAIIPNLKDFEVAGVRRTHVKAELEFLDKSRVIKWVRESNLFVFNKDYDTWVVSYTRTHDEKRLDELIHINLQDKKQGAPYESLINNLLGYQNSNQVTETGTELPKQELNYQNSNSVTKTVVNGYQNSNFSEQQPPATPGVEGSLKKVLNKDINNISSSSIEDNPVENFVDNVDNPLKDPKTGELVKFFSEQFIIMASPYQVEKVLAWTKEPANMDPDLVKWAIEQALVANVRRLDYVEGILRNLYNEGITTREQAEARNKQKEGQARGKQQKKQQKRTGGNRKDVGDLVIE